MYLIKLHIIYFKIDSNPHIITLNKFFFLVGDVMVYYKPHIHQKAVAIAFPACRRFKECIRV